MSNTIYVDKYDIIIRLWSNYERTKSQQHESSFDFFSLGMSLSSFAQENDTLPSITFSAGLWSGTNGKVVVIGVPVTRLSVTTKVSKKARLEVGATLLPGLIIDSTGERLGLSAGGTVTLHRMDWKLKPMVGVVFLKTDTWQSLPGIGFLF